MAELWPLYFDCHHFIPLLCIIISYRSSLKFVPVEWFLANLQPLSIEICCRFLIISRFAQAILFPWINLVNLRRLENADLKQQFVILSLLLRELKKDETFASLLNIHGGDIRIVPTHLVCVLFLQKTLRYWIEICR